MSKINNIAVFTSGGDAPGMNAAIRAVVRTCIHHKLKIFGIIGGYQGMINDQIQELQASSVANIIQRGGTILKSGRSTAFHQKEIRSQAYENLKKHNIDAVVCIGGDGSFTGAHLLYKEHGLPIVGVPGTIDNDIFGTDYTIGFDSAINTAVESIDRIRDTAASHDRLFIVEVMGRNSGFIAAEVALAGGAEEVFMTDSSTTVDQAIDHIQRGLKRGKTSSILIAAEGQKSGRAYDLAESIRKKSGFEAKVCVLGHVQRGGAPTAFDRNLASKMGAAAVVALLSDQTDVFISMHKHQLSYCSLEEGFSKKRSVPKDILDLIQILSS
ncbi:MAG: 6-phosphofructokinase [Bdellovibrionales bacterium]|nr:6-phosphofructokinase [Bdellovibrionales bacterium]